MRKLSSILLLFLLCFALAGYHLLFQYQIQKAKLEMMTFLKDQKQHKDIITFSFNKNEYGEISWENEREFEYKNEMYDVIDKKKEDDRMVIRCISDEKETALLNDYQKTSRQNHSNQYVLQLLTAAFILPENDLIKPSQKFVKKVFENYAPSLPSLAFSVLLPPPDVC